MRALITGANGFAGRWLAEHLEACGDEVTAFGRSDLDVSDQDGIEARLADLRPDAVYHLAAITVAADARLDPVRAFDVNVLGTVRLLEALRRVAPECTVIVTGSAQAYGDVSPRELPLREDQPLRPRGTYAASKAAQEQAALAYADGSGPRVIVVRPFNHTGPGQSPAFVVPSLAAQVLSGGPVHLGNLDVARDFTDVRDVVRAYRLLAADSATSNIYNVCSGTAITIGMILAMLGEIAGVAPKPIVDLDRVRKGEPIEIRGSHARLTRATGWLPAIDLHTTLTDIVRALRHKDAGGPLR